MKRQLSAALLAVVAGAASLPAQAVLGPINFSRDGGSDQIVVNQMLWNSNNVLMDNLLRQETLIPGILGSAAFNDSWTLYGQSTLATFTPGSDTLNAGKPSCVGANCFMLNGTDRITFEFGIDMETLGDSSISQTGLSTLNSAIAAGGSINYFNIYFMSGTVVPNAVAGTGYGDVTGPVDPTRKLILGGNIVSAGLGFNLNSATQLKKLDSNGTDTEGFEDIGTFFGNGSIQFAVEVLTQDDDFFLSDLRNSVVDIGTNLSTSQTTPFVQQDPSISVQGIGPDYGNDQLSGDFFKAGGATGLGATDPVNGTRTMNDHSCGTTDDGLSGTKICDFLAQSNFIQTFNNPESVPAPVPLALLGLGLMMMGVRSLRR